MGLPTAVRALLRESLEGVFRRNSPPSDQVFDVVLADIEQIAFRLPPGVRNRSSVCFSALRHLESMAQLCTDSMFGKDDVTPRVPVVYALFDSPARVTPAKQACQLLRFARASKREISNADELIEQYEAGDSVACAWSAFMSCGAARRVVIRCLAEDMVKVEDPFQGKAVLIVDPPTGPALTEAGEAEIKSLELALKHDGFGVIIDSSDSDLMAMWLAAGIKFYKEPGFPGEGYKINVSMRSMVSGGKKPMSYTELLEGLTHNEAITAEEAAKRLAEVGVTPNMRSDQMPPEVHTYVKTVVEYTDLNAMHSKVVDGPAFLGCSLAFMGLFCGSDLVMGNANGGNPLPNVGAEVALTFYLDNYAKIGDVAGYRMDGHGRFSLYCNMKNFWKFVRLVYWAKMNRTVKRADVPDGAMPTYTQLEKINRSKKSGGAPKNETSAARSAARQMPSKKQLAISFANARYALGYYAGGKVFHPTALHPASGLSVNGWYTDRETVARLPDWDHDLDNPKELEHDDEDLLHDQERLTAWADAKIEWGEKVPPPVPMTKKAEENRDARRRKRDQEQSECTTGDSRKKSRKRSVSAISNDDAFWDPVEEGVPARKRKTTTPSSGKQTDDIPLKFVRADNMRPLSLGGEFDGDDLMWKPNEDIDGALGTTCLPEVQTPAIDWSGLRVTSGGGRKLRRNDSNDGK